MGQQNILLRTRKKKALACFEARQYDEAWTLYQGICQADRLDADAQLACGVIAGLRGEHALAEDYCRQVLVLAPKRAAGHYNLGIALRNQGRLAEARDAFKRATDLQPNYSDAMDALAHAHIALYDWPGAVQVLNEIISIWPLRAEIRHDLGTVYQAMGHSEAAISAFKAALKINPRLPDTQEAIAQAYISLYDWPAAARVLNEIILNWPQKAEMRHILGAVYQAMGHSEAAIAAFEAALKINPCLSGTLNSLGGVYMGQGDFVQAEHFYRQCLAATPGDLRARSNLLMLLNYLPDAKADAVFTEHLEWGRVAEARMQPLEPITFDRDPQRRLRVGYLSPDFCEHSVASFIEPVLRHHDRGRFEVWCYSNLPRPDETTIRLKACADGWRDIDKLSDSEVARLIRDDRIDILVDIAGHTANNRLAVLAARPAPLQMTWIGYPNTTGLRAVDYRITDSTCDPMGEEFWFSEQLLRLPVSFLCYQPHPDAPEVSLLPALANGHVTFGSFNNFSKINPGVLRLWSEVLKQVPGSRLLLKCPALTDADVRTRVSAALAELGIGAERVDLLGHTRTRQEHLALYAGVDIALDTFPYNGTTTTCEALWMGVPVLSLLGKHHAGRVGASLLSAAGLPEWLADTPDSFVAIARVRAADLTGLRALREGLRSQLAGAPLCDAEAFVRRLDDALCQAWDRRAYAGQPKGLA